MERSAYFLAARTVVNREDPIGLLRMGAPEGEYDAEVRDLIRWRTAVTTDQVSAVFLRWFEDSGTIPSGWRRVSQMASTKPVPSMSRHRQTASK